MLGGGIYACVIAGICEALTNSNPGHSLFTKTMDTTNMYLEHINLPEDERPVYREYLVNSYERLQERLYKNTLEFFSPDLQGALAIHCHSKWICRVPFFLCDDDTENARFVVALARELKGMSFTRGEALVYQGNLAKKMYIVKKGIVGCGGRIRTRGQFLGQDMILTHGISRSTARALTFVDAMVLTRKAFVSLLKLQNFGQNSKKINIARVRLALLRWFQFVGSLMCRVAHAFRRPLSRVQLEAYKLQMRQRAAKTKRNWKKLKQPTIVALAFAGNRPNCSGHVLNKDALEDKFEMFRAQLPKAARLFPEASKTSAEAAHELAERNLKKCIALEEKNMHLQLCMEALLAKMGVESPVCEGEKDAKDMEISRAASFSGPLSKVEERTRVDMYHK